MFKPTLGATKLGLEGVGEEFCGAPSVLPAV